MRVLFRFVYSCLIVVGLGGCAASSKHMKPVAAPSGLAAPPGMALVVFVRPDDGAVIDKYTVFNDRLQFLGDAMVNTWFVAGLPPGKYTFVPDGKRPRPLQAELEAGGVYYVKVVSMAQSWGNSNNASRFTHIIAVRKGTERWTELQKAMKEGQYLEPALASGQSELDAKRLHYSKILDEARETFTDYEAEDRLDHTLERGDRNP